MKYFKGIALGLFILVGIFCFSLQAQNMNPENPELIELSRTIRSSENTLSKYPENDFTPTLMFQLSALYIKRAAILYDQKMDVFEQAERQFSDGLISTKPSLPKIDFSEAISISQNLLVSFPESAFKDKVYYRMALCYSEQGETELAAANFQKVADLTNDAIMADEAYFRLGEYYFDQREYKSTIDFYSRLLHGWDSPFFDMALYKLGWAYYNINDFDKAISTFIRLVEGIEEFDQTEYSDYGKTKTDLRSEAIEYISVSFAADGGPSQAGEFLSDKKDKKYTEKVLSHLADIYRKRNFYGQAIEILEILQNFYPEKMLASNCQSLIVENYDLAGDEEKVDIAKREFISNFGPDSKWYLKINAEVQTEVLTVAEEYVYSLGTEAQVKAQSTNIISDFETAIKWYEFYISKFPDYERAHKVQFYLGECFYDIEQFEQAAVEYNNLLVHYGTSEFAASAAYNRILALNHILKTDTSPDTTKFFLFNFLGKQQSGVDIVENLNSGRARLLLASNKFFLKFPGDSKVNEVLVNYARVLFELKKYDLTKQICAEVTRKSEKDQYTAQAYWMTAQSEFQQNNFVAAEHWFQQLVDAYPDSASLLQKTHKMIATSQFRKAEAFLAEGDTAKAVVEFEAVFNKSKDPVIAERALFDAAKNSEAFGEKMKAISLYQQISVKFPKSELVEQALLKAGRLCEDTQNWACAAENYLLVYKKNQLSEFAPKALFLAAQSYEKLHDYDKARDTFGEYTRVYDGDADTHLEAAFKRAELAMRISKNKSAIVDLNFLLNAYARFVKKNIPVENYMPANAQFLLGEIKFEEFDNIKLTAPVKRKLARKKALFQEVIKAYTEAAKYKVAEWTTASSYKIGLTFETFAEALLTSPKPANLSSEQMLVYIEKLNESVLPLKEKAQKTYETNVKNAYENSIVNKWVSESEKRLNILKLELEQKVSEVTNGKNG